MMRRQILPLSVAIMAICCSLRADEFQVLSGKNGDPKKLLRADFRKLSHELLDRRQRRLDQIQTEEQITSYQATQRAKLVQLLGGLPKRTSLNARVVGRLKGDGFRAEKILFESRPKFYVTGILYLPLTTGPHPAVLHPCGHTENGKAGDSYQRASILLAQNGIACFCFDPIGQGERKQLLTLDSDAKSPGLFRSTGEHLIEGVHPILLGENIATYMIWDGIRAIDYLCDRKDIRADRIGCTGNSGGGNMTSFLMAIDRRIACAAPGCFMTNTRYKNDRPGPGDAEQNIFGQTRAGIDHPDFMLLRAPRPTLICAATRDFVPIRGTWVAYREAKRWYSRMGYPERVDLVETDNKHGFTKPLREAVARWMSRWLLGRDEPIIEGPIRIFTERELRCSPAGQVILIDGARNIFDLYREQAEQLAKSRQNRFAARKLDQLRKTVRRLNRIPDKIEPAAAGPVGKPVVGRSYTLQRLVLTNRRKFPLPGLLFTPRQPKGQRILLVNGNGKRADLKRAQVLATAGATVLTIDVRGCGETETKPWRYTSMAPYIGNNAAEFYVAYMSGQSFVGLRTEEILSAALYLHGLKSESTETPIRLIASGVAAIPALHAAALETNVFGRVELSDTIRTWTSLFETPVTRHQLENTVHGALRAYDLPDLLPLAGPRILYR